MEVPAWLVQTWPMKTVILFRHAKAVREHEAPSDRQRGLTARGHRDAGAAGAAITDAGLKPDFAMISDARRTRETAADALAAIAPLDARVTPALYLAAPEAIWAAAMEAPAEVVVVIGHNPGMHALVAHLVEASYERAKAARDAAEHMPTAAWAAFEVSGSDIASPGARFIAAWRPARED